MYNTGNPIGSTAPKDFSDNSEITDRYVNDVVNETTLDRFGRSRLTIHGQQEKARRSFDQFESDADALLTEKKNEADNVIANLGFFSPVDYATGLTVDSRNFTVTYNGVVYAAQPSAVPFTTGAWDDAQWYPIQNVLNQKNLLVFDTYAEASAAAATLPDGQIVDALDVQERYEVTGGALVFVSPLSTVFRTRNDFVAAVASGKIGSLVNGSIVRAGDLYYAYSAGSSVLPGLPGFVHSGVLDGRHHGMICDGVAEDAAAFTSWAANVAQLWNTAATTVQLRGKIRFDSPVVLTQNQTLTTRHLTIDLSGVEFICGFERTVAAEAMFTVGNIASPATYSAPFSIVGRYRLTRRANVNFPPVGFRFIGIAQSDINHPISSSWGNTLFEFWGPQNVELEDMTLYSGGYCFGYRDASDSRFRRTGTSLSRVSGTFTFDESCVGKTIRITPLTNDVKCKITAFVDATTVTIESSASATDNSDREIRFGSPAVFTNAGSNVIRIDGPVTDDMKGLLVGIPRAGANGKVLIARVTGANPETRYITLSKNASVTLNPTVSPLSQTTEIACPAVAVLSELASEGGYYSNGVSQFRFGNIQIETYRGLALLLDDVESLTFLGWKSHGVQTDYRWDIHSIADIWANRASGYFAGEFDAARYGMYRCVIGDNTMPLNFMHLSVRSAVGEKLLYVSPMVSGYETAVVSFDFVSMSGGTAGAFTNLVDDANTTYPGYVPPLRLIRPDKNETYQYLGRTLFSGPNGVESTGAFTVDNNFRLLAQAALLRIVDVDASGNIGISFEANQGVTKRAELRVSSSTGRISTLIDNVAKGLAANSRSADAVNIPVYESSGAAKAGGLITDDIYKTAAGDLKVVV